MRVGLLCLVWASLGCPGGEAPAPSTCLEPLDLQCTPLYEPTYEQVFRQTLMPKCGVGNGSCHDPSGANGGLVVSEAEATHEALLEGGRVLPGDPECSLLIRVVEGHPSVSSMPPGTPLSTEERCALIQWVASGAASQP